MDLFNRFKKTLLRTPIESHYYRQEKAELESAINENLEFLIDLMAHYADVGGSHKDYKKISFTYEYLNKQAFKASFSDNDKRISIIIEQDLKIIHLLRSIKYAEEVVFNQKKEANNKVKLRILLYAFMELKDHVFEGHLSALVSKNLLESDLSKDYLKDINLALENMRNNCFDILSALGKKKLLELLEGVDIIINPDNKNFTGQPREINPLIYRSHLKEKYSVLFN